MKFSTALALVFAPLSLAAKVRNSYPPARRDPPINPRKVHFSHPKDKRSNHESNVILGDLLQFDSSKDSSKDSKHRNNYDSSSSNQPQVIIIWANPGNNAATTTVNEKVTVTQVVTAPAGGQATPPAAAASHTVTVGGDAGLVYTPDQLNNVPVGDMVIFEFMAQNHTVTQSGFDTPCAAMAGGMDTGHQANPDNTVVPPPQVAMQVTSSDPLWFYCQTGDHCAQGMVFSINPTKEKSQAAFKKKAMADGGAAAPPAASSAVSTPVATPTPQPGQDQNQNNGGGSGNTPGQGTVGQDGSCTCVVSCSAGSFPDAGVQGLGSFGGNAGSLAVVGM